MSARVGLCGASGTGKSSLANKIGKRFGLELNPIGSRSTAKEMGFDSPYEVDKAGKRAAFQYHLQHSKLDWENVHESFVTDRTPLDELAYTILHDWRAVTPSYWDRAMRHMSRYTVVIFCPIVEFQDLGADVARMQHPTYHQQFEALLRGLLEHAQVVGVMGAAQSSGLVLQKVAHRYVGLVEAFDAYHKERQFWAEGLVEASLARP